MKRGFISKRSGENPPGYYRNDLRPGHFRRVMDGAGPLSITQIAAMLSDDVTPEAKRRSFTLTSHGKSDSLPLVEKLFIGMRNIVKLKMFTLIRNGKAVKHGSGREAKYEWIEAKDGKAGQDSA